MSGYAALVTGASRGIGKGIALALASRGFSIAVNALVHDGEVEETLAELRRGGVKATAAIGDISDISKHESILDNAELGVGDLTTLVNNAGVSVLQRGDLLDVTPESYDRCEAVNARGTFFLTQSWARRIMARQEFQGLSSLDHNGVVLERGRGFDRPRRILHIESRCVDDRQTFRRASRRR